MKEHNNKIDIAKDLTFHISDVAFARFKSFCSDVLGASVDEVPSQESIFMRQNFAIVFFATILFLLTNGFYLVKNIALNTMLALDMVPLYMMTATSLAMLIFVRVNKKYDSPLSRFALLAFYTVVIASVTVFMVSCNFHKIGLSISMCYLFVINSFIVFELLLVIESFGLLYVVTTSFVSFVDS